MSVAVYVYTSLEGAGDKLHFRAIFKLSSLFDLLFPSDSLHTLSVLEVNSTEERMAVLSLSDLTHDMNGFMEFGVTR